MMTISFVFIQLLSQRIERAGDEDIHKICSLLLGENQMILHDIVLIKNDMGLISEN